MKVSRHRCILHPAETQIRSIHQAAQQQQHCGPVSTTNYFTNVWRRGSLRTSLHRVCGTERLRQLPQSQKLPSGDTCNRMRASDRARNGQTDTTQQQQRRDSGFCHGWCVRASPYTPQWVERFECGRYWRPSVGRKKVVPEILNLISKQVPARTHARRHKRTVSTTRSGASSLDSAGG